MTLHTVHSRSSSSQNTVTVRLWLRSCFPVWSTFLAIVAVVVFLVLFAYYCLLFVHADIMDEEDFSSDTSDEDYTPDGNRCST